MKYKQIVQIVRNAKMTAPHPSTGIAQFGQIYYTGVILKDLARAASIAARVYPVHARSFASSG
jgi:hypothetical protein